MTAVDDKVQAGLVKAMAKLGTSATVTYETSYSFDEAEGEATIGTSSKTITITIPAPVRLLHSEFSLVQQGDAQTVIENTSTLGFTPHVGMEVEYGGRVFTAVEVRDLPTNTRIAGWHLLLRMKGPAA